MQQSLFTRGWSTETGQFSTVFLTAGSRQEQQCEICNVDVGYC